MPSLPITSNPVAEALKTTVIFLLFNFDLSEC